jgi:hypothetical protein
VKNKKDQIIKNEKEIKHLNNKILDDKYTDKQILNFVKDRKNKKLKLITIKNYNNHKKNQINFNKWKIKSKFNSK